MRGEKKNTASQGTEVGGVPHLGTKKMGIPKRYIRSLRSREGSSCTSHIFTHLFTYSSIHPFVYSSIHPLFHPSTLPCVHLFIYPSICSSTHPSVHLTNQGSPYFKEHSLRKPGKSIEKFQGKKVKFSSD